VAVLDDVLSSLRSDAPVRDLSVCLRVTAVWSRCLGLAYSFPRERRSSGDPRPARPLYEMTARELAGMARSPDANDASIGVAAINSLIEPDPSMLREGKAHDLIVERGAGRRVTVVGHFPFVDAIREKVGELCVLEKEPREGDLPAEEAGRVIPRSDVVAITGTALINGTLDELLALARGRTTIVLGPSTVLSPVFFDHGVDAVCGSVVTAPEQVLRCVRAGTGFRHIEGLRPVIMERG